MTHDEKKKIKAVWIKLSAYYQVQLQDYIFEMYAEDVSDLSFAMVIHCMDLYRRDPRNTRVPLPAAIRNLVAPEIDDDTLAREAASRTISAVSRFGWPNPDRAREYVGELGWRVVERYGGWEYICQNLGVTLKVEMFQAQFRDVAKTQALLARSGRADTPPALPASRSDKVAGIIGNAIKTIEASTRQEETT